MYKILLMSISGLFSMLFMCGNSVCTVCSVLCVSHVCLIVLTRLSRPIYNIMFALIGTIIRSGH